MLDIAMHTSSRNASWIDVILTCNLYFSQVMNANGTGTESSVLHGINWVVKQVKQQRENGTKPRAVINMSLGSRYPSMIQYNALQDAVEEGITVVVSAGNDGLLARHAYPAGFNNTIAVGASDSADIFAYFSNWGQEVDIIAPGVSILAACSTYSPLCAGVEPEHCVAYYTGTSQAAPHVTGMVAKHLSSLRDIELDLATPPAILNMLINTASINFIVFRARVKLESTPNRLLYRGCGGAATTTPSLLSTTTTSTPIIATSSTTTSPTTTTSTTASVTPVFKGAQSVVSLHLFLIYIYQCLRF